MQWDLKKNMSPFSFFWNDVFTFINGGPHNALQSFGGVLWSKCGVIVGYKVLHFVIIVCFRYDYHGVPFVCFGDYSLGRC